MNAQIFLIAPADAVEAFVSTLQDVLAAAQVSALLLPRGTQPENAYKSLVKAVVPIAQHAGSAVLIEGDPGLVRMLGADGLHISDVSAIKPALGTLKPQMIVGTATPTSRDEAMTRGEMGVDYVMFGPLSGAIDAETRDMARWWAETMEVPSILSDPAAVPGTMDAEGCEFIGLGESIWQASRPGSDSGGTGGRTRSQEVKLPLALLALLLAFASPGLAQDAPVPAIRLDAAANAVSDLSAADAEGTNAVDISKQVFGPRLRRDDAYGAYQRGYFLTALALALPRAEQADPAAQTLIAEIYSKGLGVALNPARASGWYALAAKNGDRLASFELGVMYQDGTGVPKNRERAAELFREAAELNYPPAEYNLALLYVEGLYAKPDLIKAAQLMQKAAEAGLAEAQYDYGTMLVQGAGVAPDPKEGARQFGLAAQQGLVAAQVDYATALYLGHGISRNLNEAVGWYQRAAQAGNPVAQSRLAKLLAVGEGIGLDLKQAAMWRALARRQGLTDALLDKLLVSILPADLAAAEELARFWPSQPPAPDGGGTAPATQSP